MAVSSTRATELASELVVRRWTEAFNARDLEGMLECLADDVELRPLRLSGLERRYRGRDGVRDWFERLQRLGYDHRIVISQVRTLENGGVLASGSLGMTGDVDLGPFCGLHRIDDGLIATAQQYMSDPEMIERLGLAP